MKKKIMKIGKFNENIFNNHFHLFVSLIIKSCLSTFILLILLHKVYILEIL